MPYDPGIEYDPEAPEADEQVTQVLANPQQANQQQLTYFFAKASDEQKQELYNDLGVDITSFSDEVLDRIENYFVGGQKVKDYSDYNRDEIETLIASKTPARSRIK